MADVLEASLKLILEGRQTLAREDSRRLLDSLFERLQAPELAGAALLELQTKVAALLGALAARGETGDELAGFVDALRERAIRIPLSAEERAQLVDTCGTGGDSSGTFNISTAAALVAAAAGAKVAKHGNRAVTSKCGSADVLEIMGIPVNLPPEQAAEALREHGFCFLAAPAMQPGMKSLMPVRKALGVRTAFNILGPMTNPAGAAAQVMGVYSARLVPLVAETMTKLRTRHAFVVHGAMETGSGIDEFSISGPTVVGEVRGNQVRLFEVTPMDFGLKYAPINALAGNDAISNAEILRKIFRGERGPRRDVVVMNAAAVLVTAGIAHDFPSGTNIAQDTIDAGRVADLVERLAAEQSWGRLGSGASL